MSRIVDLSQPLSRRSPRSVDHPEVEFKTLRTFVTHSSQTHTVYTSVHTGTHMDAPSLYFKDGKNIDEIPVGRLFGPGVILDMTRDDWGIITGDDLENARPRVERGDIVMLHTGWHRFYFDDQERYYLKTPGVDKSACDWLVERKVNVVLGEGPAAEHFFMHSTRWRTLRPDVVGKLEFDAARFPQGYFHTALLRNDILIIDQAGGQVDEIVGRRCQIGVMPIMYEGVEAAPVRAFAVVDQ
ncbi:MAG: cyclase family protein [Chloroflexota bacterium]|nr:cyclase family protein [Chloroflexota bacterium]